MERQEDSEGPAMKGFDDYFDPSRGLLDLNTWYAALVWLRSSVENLEDPELVEFGRRLKNELDEVCNDCTKIKRRSGDQYELSPGEKRKGEAGK